MITNNKMIASVVQMPAPMPIKSKNKRARSSTPTSKVLSDLVKAFETEKPNNICIMAISREHNLQHRRVYDFFNLMSSLGVCNVVERGRISWNGLLEIKRSLQKAYEEVEAKSLTQNLETLFRPGHSPSLGAIALSFLCLYLYLGITTLPIRQVSLLFHDGQSEIKSLERRVYLVLNFLEVVGVVQHTSKTGEYKLVLDCGEIVEKAMRARRQLGGSWKAWSIESLLNRYDHAYLFNLYADRCACFANWA